MTPAPTIVAVEIREALSSSYEELRHIALAGTGVRARGIGLALLIRSGMARWMEACVTALARPTLAVLQQIETPPLLPADVRVEVAMVLAQMALSTQSQGATAC